MEKDSLFLKAKTIKKYILIVKKIMTLLALDRVRETPWD